MWLENCFLSTAKCWQTFNGFLQIYHSYYNKKLLVRSVHTIQFWSNYHFKFFVHDEKCWRSHNPIFPSNYFVMYSRETRQFLFWEFRAHFTAARSSKGGHFVKIFCRIKCGKIKNWRRFWSDRMETERVLFSSNTGCPKKVHKFEIKNLCSENRSISKVSAIC